MSVARRFKLEDSSLNKFTFLGKDDAPKNLSLNHTFLRKNTRLDLSQQRTNQDVK